jgi:hypothetical protein
MKHQLEPVPSPTGRNDERLFMLCIPRGSSPEQALDAAMKRGGRDKRRARDQHEEAAELRDKFFDAMSVSGMSEDMTSSVMDLYDGVHSRDTKRFGDDSEGEAEWLKREDEPEEHGGSGHPGEIDADDESEAIAESRGIARRMETGSGDRRRATDRRADDRRRRAHDHQLGQDEASARESFNEMFGADRIGNADNLR